LGFVVAAVVVVAALVVVVAGTVEELEVVGADAVTAAGEARGERAACEAGTGPTMADSETLANASAAVTAGPLGER
jgi:hypothetical protein